MLIPSLDQFRKWSLPSKVTYIAFILTILGLFLTLAITYLQRDQSTIISEFNPALPAEYKDGTCWTNSFTNRRANAWRCASEGIYDPCFQKLDPLDEFSEPKIICGASPGDEGNSFIVRLIAPLPEPDDERPMLGLDTPESAWIIVLKAGDICRFSSGVTKDLLGNRINYFCGTRDDGNQIWLIGFPRAGAIWSIQGVIMNSDNSVIDDEIYQIAHIYR